MGALFLEAFAQAVDAQHALLLNALDSYEADLRAAGCLADGGVVGVVLAAFALHPVGA